MAGIFGICAPEGRLPRGHLQAFLDDMAAEYDEPAWRVEKHVSSGLAVGCAYYDGETPPPPVTANSRYHLATAGNFLMIDREPVSDWPRDRINATLLQRCADGVETLPAGHIDGRFAIVAFDRPARRLHLATDRFGLYPLYYCLTEGILWFATRLAAVVKPNRAHLDLDHDAMADYLAHRHFLGNETFFRQVRLVPEGTRVTFDGESVTEERYWNYRLAENRRDVVTGAEAVRRLRTAWARSMDAAARAPGRPGVALSGGLDSRAIVAALHARGRKASTYTFGDPGSNDIRFATQTARLLGLPHETTTLDRARYFISEHATVVRRTDGSLPMNHAHLAALRPLMLSTADVLYDGLTGGVLSIGKVQQHHQAISPEDAREKLSRYYRLFGDETVRPLLPGAAPFEQRAERYGHYYSHFGHGLSSSAAICFSNSNRQRRFTSQSPRFLEGDKRVICPFWTIDYADTCFAMAPKDRITRGPFVELNRSEYPHLNAVGWTMTGLPLTWPLPAARTYMRFNEGISHVLYYLRTWQGMTWLPAFEFGFDRYYDWIRQEPVRSFVHGVLDDDFVDRLGFLDRAAIRRVLSDHEAVRGFALRKNVDLIGALLSTVLYFQHGLHW